MVLGKFWHWSWWTLRRGRKCWWKLSVTHNLPPHKHKLTAGISILLPCASAPKYMTVSVAPSIASSRKGLDWCLGFTRWCFGVDLGISFNLACRGQFWPTGFG
jgi:hypothetical protein